MTAVYLNNPFVTVWKFFVNTGIKHEYTKRPKIYRTKKGQMETNLTTKVNIFSEHTLNMCYTKMAIYGVS